MGLVLFPDDGDLSSPDISWSHHGFHLLRQRLAEAEGFTLTAMAGFGGDRPWTDVVTTLAPLLDHPDDDGPDLTPAQCAAMLPRLETIVERWQREAHDPVVRHHLDDLRQLVVVLRFCLAEDVDLSFG
ncbi:hypothetical protein [Actinoalloteichus hymeniacidonis]|uniref:Uncharacterized protein n=1 Tax=Actinoalloteichus hymeniacidonis TaxID=340345 RepID=A0AAC9MZK5_9PSEU|nr:hypothetical protein [Actinoalloteichus hymeniacidonis]AOS64051.1 hypothetical protein TL08_16255 [Actinoalloteichus hymeniacidonis]MBB5907887.1 hypothetical protein [Actinoalloteichus hymeniacidonis]